MSSHFICGCTKQMYLSPEFLNLLSWLQSNIYYCVYQVKKIHFCGISEKILIVLLELKRTNATLFQDRKS